VIDRVLRLPASFQEYTGDSSTVHGVDAFAALHQNVAASWRHDLLVQHFLMLVCDPSLRQRSPSLVRHC
jgi:hypothetical protein